MTNISKNLSFILRHRPEAANLDIDSEGWVAVEQVLKHLKISRILLTEVVENDEKTRYSFSADGTKIRANQGHSTPKVKLTYTSAVPPPALYHGTILGNVSLIEKRGLLPMKRSHVHLSADEETAVTVAGRRKGDAVLFEVDTVNAIAAGINFFKSENSVWLVEHMPAKFLRRLT